MSDTLEAEMIKKITKRTSAFFWTIGLGLTALGEWFDPQGGEPNHDYHYHTGWYTYIIWLGIIFVIIGFFLMFCLEETETKLV